MNETKVTTTVAEKPAKAPAKTAAKAPVKSKAKPVDKAARDAERAKRYPTAAKKEAEKAVAKKEPKERKLKPAREQVAFIAKSVKQGDSVYAISELHNARPTSGRRLYAHTHAALSLLGLLAESRPSVPQSAAVALIGQRAVKYHIGEGNIETVKDGGLRLTAAGRTNFLERQTSGKVDNKLANAFTDLFTTGKVSDVVEVPQSAVFKIAG